MPITLVSTYAEVKMTETMIVTMFDRAYYITADKSSIEKFSPNEMPFICGVHGLEVKECTEVSEYIIHVKRVVL